MAHIVAHTFVSPVVDEGDPDLVGPDEWNANHSITIDASLIDHNSLANLTVGNPHTQYLQTSIVSGMANPTASVGLTAVNGSATTAMRSDAAPPLSQAIVPTWTGNHTWSIAGTNGTPISMFRTSDGFAWGHQINSAADYLITFTSSPVTALGLTIGGSGRITTSLRVGSQTNPTNTTAGDLTAVRLFMPDAALVSGVRKVQITETWDPTTTQDFFVYLAPTVTPGAATDGAWGLYVAQRTNPTAANASGGHNAAVFENFHQSGAFNISALAGGVGAAAQQTASSTVATGTGWGSYFQNDNGTTTLARGLYTGIFVNGGTVTTGIGLEIDRSQTAGTYTTAIGIRINAASGTIGTNIAIQSLGGHHRFVGDVKIGADSTPTVALDVTGVILVTTGFRQGTLTAGRYLRSDGTNFVSNTIQSGDLPGSFSGFANPTASVGLSTVNGSATTAMRSDAAPPLSQAIQPVWTALHTFLPTYTLSGGVGANTVVISGVHSVSSAVSETHGLLVSPTFDVTTSNTLAAAISHYIFTTTGSSGGAITNLFASYNVANYGTIKPATAIGSYIGNFGSTGITTSYGLWVEAQSGSTTPIAIYSAGGQNRIVGATTIGSNNAPVSATGVVLNLNTGGGTGVDHIMVLGPSTSAGGLNVAYGGASFGSGISFINAHSPSAGTAEFRVLTQANSLTSWHNTDGGLRHGFYIRVGAFTAPSNTTVGDITATRAFFPNAALAGSNSAGGAIQSVKSFTPNGTSVGGTFNAVQYIGATVTPTNTGSATAFNTDVLYVNTDVQVGATGSGSSFFNGINSTITHSTGAGTTTGVRAGYYVMINSSGTTTLGIGVSANLVVTGGTVTTGVGVDVQMTRSAGTLTTSIGIRINANAPGTVGTNIAIQSLSGEHRFVGSVKIGANSSPAVPLDVVGAITTDTGYRIGNAAAATSILAGDGTNFVAQFTGNNVVAFNAGNFTASNSQTWTVASGDQLIYNYMRVGKWMTVTFFIQSSTLSGAADFFFLAIPGGLFPDGYYYNTCRVLEGVTYHPNAIVQTVAGQSKLYISKNIGGIFSGDQWAAGTDNYYILGEITFPVT